MTRPSVLFSMEQMFDLLFPMTCVQLLLVKVELELWKVRGGGRKGRG